MGLLEGKTALVTGASRGIGRAIAIKFAEHGAFVGINYFKSREKAEKVLDEVKKYSDGMILKADVSDDTEVKKMVEIFVEKAEKIDILVNNAGIYRRSLFLHIKPEQWDKIMNVNLKGCYNVCRHSIPYMKEGGKIVFMSSQLAFKGSTHGADYAASKAGILGFMRSLALELADRKINVNAVAPGTIDTDIIASYTPEQREKRAMEVPLKRIGMPEDVANACLFLASGLSDYITGETIHVNGGLYIR
ncbi:MAG: SDR family NAD(P)-dependent oxidoreductase [Thermoplasmata archaeon]|nr:MAG: SDR family NAD(P)-dependent oxidoreductase [Thermoplasmata archaeon]